MKICIKCGVEKDYYEFNFRNKIYDTRIATCKSCIIIYNKKYNKDNKKPSKKKIAINPVNNKICSKCKVEKNKNCFGVNNRTIDKLNYSCKSCEKVQLAIFYKNNEFLIKEKKIQKIQIRKEKRTQIKKEKEESKTKICTKCKFEKDKGCFSLKNKEKNILNSHCKNCKKEKYKENKDKISKKNKIIRADIKKNSPEKYKEGQEYRKEYNLKNKNEKQIYNKNYRIKNADKLKKAEKMRRNNPVRKLHQNATRAVNHVLKNIGSSKYGNSFIKTIGYKSQRLMGHLMNHPDKEPWMNENNQGQYRLDKWDDNDPSTWVWNVDHIIPISDFNIDQKLGMDCPEFKKCWALENLRPLSAKQNIIDGATRVRHKKERKSNVNKNNLNNAKQNVLEIRHKKAA